VQRVAVAKHVVENHPSAFNLSLVVNLRHRHSSLSSNDTTVATFSRIHLDGNRYQRLLLPAITNPSPALYIRVDKLRRVSALAAYRRQCPSQKFHRHDPRRRRVAIAARN